MNCFVDSEMETIQSQMYPTAGNRIDNNSRNVLLFECDNSNVRRLKQTNGSSVVIRQLTYLWPSSIYSVSGRGADIIQYIRDACHIEELLLIIVCTYAQQHDASLYCVCSCLFWCLVNLSNLLPIEVSEERRPESSTPAASDSLVLFLFLISFSSGRLTAQTFIHSLLFCCLCLTLVGHKAIIRCWKGKHKCCCFLMIIQDPFLGWIFFFCLLDYFSSISEWLLFDAVVPGTWWFIATPTLLSYSAVVVVDS